MADLKHEVKELLIESLHLEGMTPSEIEDEAPLFGDEGLGLDSVDALELAIAVERRFQVRIEENEQARSILANVANLAAHIATARG